MTLITKATFNRQFTEFAANGYQGREELAQIVLQALDSRHLHGFIKNDADYEDIRLAAADKFMRSFDAGNIMSDKDPY